MIKEVIDNGETWLDRVEMLAAKYAHLGICDDIWSMSLEEKRGLYVHLRHRADGE